MYKIPIFKAEIDAGIGEAVATANCIAYVSQLQPQPINIVNRESIIAGITDKYKDEITDPDLYPVKSILASSTDNLNDDFFDRLEMWTARNTPINKPDNIDHNENIIVGHMLYTYAIDDKGNIIDNNVAMDDLPDLYHLVNNSVIYKGWREKANQERVDNLIASIEKGEKFVSMECFFKGFDYALISEEGQVKYVNRNKETAFLTKHLRRYGGKGSYSFAGKDYKLSRVLRQISFNGKGYVDKPANPDSIILDYSAAKVFTFATKDDIFSESGVLSNKTVIKNTEKTMSSENKYLEDQINELKESLKAALIKNTDLSDQLSKAGVAQHQAKITELEANLAKANEEIKTLNDKIAKADESLKAVGQELGEVKSAKAAIEEELNKSKAEAQKTNRVSTLVSAGLEKTEAEKLVEEFANADEKTFNRVSELAIAAFKKKEDDKKEKKDEKSAKASEDTNVDPKVLDKAEANKDAALATDENANETVEQAREALVAELSNLFKTEKKN